MQQRLLLGAHMSIKGGIDKAVDYGKSIGCTTIQLFTKSNRQWAARKIPTQEIELFKRKIQETGIIPVAHASYLINIASGDKEIEAKSVDALSLQLNQCEQLGIPYLVLHPGSCRDAQREECITRVAKNLDIALKKNNGTTMILLENMAGQGTVIGYTFEELRQIYNQANEKQRIGYCIDSCHAHAAGYDLRTPATYNHTVEKLDQILGIANIKAMHLSDSKKDLGSRVDRHAEIGKGTMGLESFTNIMNDSRLFGIPKILETPQDDLSDYATNMEVLKKLIQEKNRITLGVGKDASK